MNRQEEIIYLLGYIKANIEWLCRASLEGESSELSELLADLEQYINQEMKKFFILPQGLLTFDLPVADVPRFIRGIQKMPV